MNLEQIIMTSLKLLAVVVLVFVNGFFVAAEFALVKLRRTQLDSLTRVARGALAVLRAARSAAGMEASRPEN